MAINLYIKEAKTDIIGFLSDPENEVSNINQIQEGINRSRGTVLKALSSLESEGVVKINELTNMKIVILLETINKARMSIVTFLKNNGSVSITSLYDELDHNQNVIDEALQELEFDELVKTTNEYGRTVVTLIDYIPAYLKMEITFTVIATTLFVISPYVSNPAIFLSTLAMSAVLAIWYKNMIHSYEDLAQTYYFTNRRLHRILEGFNRHN